MKEKVDPYLRPLYDSLYDLFDFEKIQRMIEIGDIEIAPLAFMRGRTLKNSFAILDESQNATDTQIKMFLTRIGENSKIVINGDPTQIDLPNKNMSGLVRSKELLGHLNEISVVDFDHTDVVRHPLVSKIVKAYSNNKSIKKLNKNFRNKNKSTDVLSFPLAKKTKISKKTYIGDIIISYNFMNKPKSQNIKNFKKKVIKTFIHGYLHLLGFDHIKDKDYKRMLSEEEKIYKSVMLKIN